LGLLVAVALIAGAGCGVTVKRDLTAVKPAEVVFDDMCGLQEYFDALKDATLSPPEETFARDIMKDDGEKPMGGRKRFRFANEFQLHYLRKVLSDNWDKIPGEVDKASRVEIEVAWADKAGVARVVTTEEAILAVGPKSWTLPYHVCLSDLLFGESLYDTRRAMLMLPPPSKSQFSSARPESYGRMAPLPAPAPPAPPAAPAAAVAVPAPAPAPAAPAAAAPPAPGPAAAPAPAAPAPAPGAAPPAGAPTAAPGAAAQPPGAAKPAEEVPYSD
jgi:hypothetical protein